MVVQDPRKSQGRTKKAIASMFCNAYSHHGGYDGVRFRAVCRIFMMFKQTAKRAMEVCANRRRPSRQGGLPVPPREQRTQGLAWRNRVHRTHLLAGGWGAYLAMRSDLLLVPPWMHHLWRTFQTLALVRLHP